jgi:Family of unknown function (DUF5677)
MPSDEELARNYCDKLKRLCAYCMEKLESEQLTPDSLRVRTSYFHSLFIFSIAFTDGITTLCENGQLRAALPIIRSLYETWLNTKFIFACRSHIWAYYLVWNGEKQKIRKLEKIHANGDMNLEDYKKATAKARHVISALRRQHKQLPAIPNVISVPTDIENRTLKNALSIRAKCQIIDYYREQSLKKPSPYGSRMVTNYDWVYGHLSGTPHADPIELFTLYELRGKAWYIDIGGGNDRNYMSKLLRMVYMHQYEMLRCFNYYLPVKDKDIPADITDTFKAMLKRGATA